MYDYNRQYRCTIIRGKSQKEMDDLLPAYAKVIDEVCPCAADEFESLFNNAFQRFLPESARIKKTLDNHRTEVSGKLLGWFTNQSGQANFSKMTTSLHFSRIYATKCSFQMVCRNQRLLSNECGMG